MYIGKFRVFKTTKNLSVFPTNVSKGKVNFEFYKEFKTHYIKVYVLQQLSMYICIYLKLPTPLTIYLTIGHHLYQIYLDSSLSGYLSEVSPIKLSKDKKKKVFQLRNPKL